MSPPRFALVLAAMALLSLLSASLFHETLSASLQASIGYINVRLQNAVVVEGVNVCTVTEVSDEIVYVDVNGQSGDECVIEVVAQNSGTVPARLSGVDSGVEEVQGENVEDGTVLPGSSGTVKFRLKFLQNYQGTVKAFPQFVMGPP
ncbi:MAG: hypothetical protein N3D79_01650 [Acidilobaceae archaeon]|nr:hypothetical protein [Acidilobaceae archaeon]